MIYPYRCECGFEFDVVKAVSDFNRPESCERCGKEASRVFTRTQLFGTRVEDYSFNHGLGCVTRNSAHARQLAKDKGLIEVGNEKPEKHLKPTLLSYDD
jgi:putative FmdB family regulatory protein